MIIKKIIAAAAVILISAVSNSFLTLEAYTGDVPEPVALAQLNGSAGDYFCWGSDSCSKDLVSNTVNINGNAQYEISWNLTGGSAESIKDLFIKISNPSEAYGSMGFSSETYPNISFTVNNIYIDGKEIKFVQNNEAYRLSWHEETNHVRIYIIDGWNTNNSEDLGLSKDTEIKNQIKVVFTVGGLKNQGTSNVKPVVTEKPEKPKADSYLLGDIDNNGAIDALDASLALMEYSALATGRGSKLSSNARLAADVDKNGTVDALDASKILMYYAAAATGNNPCWN